jgi:hypothetical protein
MQRGEQRRNGSDNAGENIERKMTRNLKRKIDVSSGVC